MGKHKKDGFTGQGGRRENPKMMYVAPEGKLDLAASDKFESYFKDSKGRTYARLRSSGAIRRLD